MHWTELVFGVLLLALLVGLTGFFTWRQVRTLRRLRDAAEMPPEERGYLRGQVWRRLFGSLLMAILAGLFAGALFLEGPAQELAEQRAAAADTGEEAVWSGEQRDFARFLGGYWIVLLLFLLALLITAAADLLATRRFALRQMHRLQADRRAMIARQAARLRRERNGHH